MNVKGTNSWALDLSLLGFGNLYFPQRFWDDDFPHDSVRPTDRRDDTARVRCGWSSTAVPRMNSDKGVPSVGTMALR